MSSAAFFAADPLDRELKESGWEFDLPGVPAVKDKASLLMAGTFDSEKIKHLNKKIINILRKGLVRRKENRYHNLVLCREAKVLCRVNGQDRCSGKVRILSVFMFRNLI